MKRAEAKTSARTFFPLDWLPKVISEMVAIPCRESWQTGRFATPFQKLLLANTINQNLKLKL